MMRATSNPPTPAQVADAVWDELKAGHLGSLTMGRLMSDMETDVINMENNYARRSPYTYGPTGLAAGATYVPVAGTVITIAMLDGVAVNDFTIVHGTTPIYVKPDAVEGYFGAIYCDGTDVGIKNGDGVNRDLSIEGFTI